MSGKKGAHIPELLRSPRCRLVVLALGFSSSAAGLLPCPGISVLLPLRPAPLVGHASWRLLLPVLRQ